MFKHFGKILKLLHFLSLLKKKNTALFLDFCEIKHKKHGPYKINFVHMQINFDIYITVINQQ